MAAQTQSLQVSLQSLAVGTTSTWWVSVKQVEDEGDALPLSEAADFIDDLYDIDPCDDSNDGGDDAPIDDDGGVAPPVAEADFLAMARDFMASSDTCKPKDGSWTCQLTVARSHQGERYKLVLDNGKVTATKRVGERVSRVLMPDKESALTMDTPVAGGFTAQWEGAVYDRNGSCAPPEITVLGSTVNFGKDVSGALRCHYDTVYDLVDVEIHALNALRGNPDPAPCRAICFYHGLVEELELEPPDPDENADSGKLCPGSHLEPTPDSVSCYEIVRRVTLCRCSEREEAVDTVEVGVDCPDGITCPGSTETCRHLMGTRTVIVGYSRCPGEERQEGTVSDPEYYEEVCCVPPDRILPACKTVHRVFGGGKGVSDEVRALYPGARFVAVGPEDGICGTTTITWQVTNRDCCELVVPMAWDEENCADIAPGLVMVTDGLGPFTWKLHGGVGFSLHPTLPMTQKITSVRYVYVYRTGEDCGSVGITVEDQCTALQRVMLSPEGRWVQVLPIELVNTDLPAAAILCYQGARFECRYLDGENKYPARPDYFFSTNRTVYKDQYKAVSGGVLHYYCSTCGHGEKLLQEVTSGIEMPRFLVTDVEYEGRCAACSATIDSVYEWVCQ